MIFWGMMIEINKNEVPFYCFPHLAAHEAVVHGVFSRCGGYSSAPFDSLNTSFAVGDDPGHVKKNRQRVKESLGGGVALYFKQVHGTGLAVVSGTGTAAGNPGQAPMKADAAITDLRGRLLVIQVADCQAVLLYDPHRQVVANVHAGWRGSIAGIIGATLDAMYGRFGCRAGDILAGIGPSLGPCCAEFVNYKSEIPEAYWKYKIGRNHFDFWAVSHDQLTAGGVPAGNINNSRICTRCHTARFFSYRSDRQTGRFAAVIGMR